jgi:hypothetical protein
MAVPFTALLITWVTVANVSTTASRIQYNFYALPFAVPVYNRSKKFTYEA